MNPVDLTTQLAGITLRNPIVTCSGTYGFGEEYAPYCPVDSLGGITLKGITPLPRLGNPVPRLAETPAGLLNSVGLENPGLEEFLKTYLPKVRQLPTEVIANISGFSLEDYVQLAQALQKDSGLAALEVNISCPNVKHGGMHFGTDPGSAEEVISAVKAATDLPVIAKLSPNVTDIVAMARAAQRGGADVLSLINTLLGMQIDIHQQRPVLANTFGGLSGPAIKPVALRMVWQVFAAVDLPIIGMGGIVTWQDAVEFLLAGATAVSIGTGNFVNPQAPLEILRGITDYCRQRGVASVGDLVGLAHS
ncbi:dihydroorotate dehydrogenase family protein [Desulfosporosinus orientis DSM 765]|uniref:Dihydroorotate dehydrogenase n=1 Tax=Desulfosporosinus orientis (strain ATCC 19365 / DSM 765 / NCIMB 8382 / VKM B-1628 / Singapore I) TaxID=768706 RepID=G7WH90_DESOD|nr:dihydroorotate dehydrogenase [Desulfosporosinus orientis]AET70180.1 dihydroorotate dehydrogenase family protein [Desulfosporosinus orientis DSM 765]